MSSRTKRKHVCQEYMQSVTGPTGSQIIARVLQPRGNNLHQVEDSDGAVYLASMPGKFRKNIWVRRGTYLLLEPITEGHKVRAEVVRVLSADHVEELRHLERWPAHFEQKTEKVTDDLHGLSLAGNPNRPPATPLSDCDSSDDSDGSDSSDDSDGSDHTDDESDSDTDQTAGADANQRSSDS